MAREYGTLLWSVIMSMGMTMYINQKGKQKRTNTYFCPIGKPFSFYPHKVILKHQKVYHDFHFYFSEKYCKKELTWIFDNVLIMSRNCHLCAIMVIEEFYQLTGLIIYIYVYISPLYYFYQNEYAVFPFPVASLTMNTSEIVTHPSHFY